MPHEHLRIFISAVTSEFGKARDALAADLRARGHKAAVESDFRQKPDSGTMLGGLADYIRDCHIVICIVGKRSGGSPSPSDAEEFAKALPAGIMEASYTQWEYFIALHFMRRPYVYVARDDYVADEALPPSDRTVLQDAFRNHLTMKNVHYGPFSNIDQLARAVLKDLPEIKGKPEGRPQAAPKPIVLPYPSIGDLFKGRDEFMQRLRESLTRAPGGQMAIVSLFGLGGVGKTRVAVEYGRSHVEEYTALLFAVAETPEALRRNLAALAGTLVPQLDTTDDEVRRTAVVDWLNANPGWFLILDNVDSKAALAEVEKLLGALAGGHVVVTSRLANFSANFRPLELDVLAVEDAAAFLLARTAGRRRVASDDEAQACEVAQELGGLALALEQAAALISKRWLTFAQYLEQWRSKRNEVLAWFDATMTGYPRAVAVTWQTSVAQLSEGGRRLLERLAWLAPEKVPESLLDVPIPGAETENLRDAYEDLAAFSLVTRDAEGPFLLVHRLVQDVTRHSLAGETRGCNLVEALGWVNVAFAKSAIEVRNWPSLEPLIPHVRAVTEYADAVGIAEPTGLLMNQLGLLLVAKALHAEAEPLVRRVLVIVEKALGPLDPNVAACLNNLAQLLQDTNRIVEAEPLLRRALAIHEKSFGPDHPVVAIALSNLAALLEDTKRIVDAEPMMRRALAIVEKSFGPEDPQVGIALNNLAGLLQTANRLVEAEPLARRALAIDEKCLGPEHPNVAIRLNNLGQLLQDTNRLEEAGPLMRRALAIDEKGLGPEHPTVAIRLSNLARLLRATNRLEEAEPLMRRVVAIRSKFTRLTGYTHPNLEVSITNYASLLAAMGKGQAEIDAVCAVLLQPLE